MEEWLGQYTSVAEVVEAYKELPMATKKVLGLPRDGGGRNALDLDRITDIMKGNSNFTPTVGSTPTAVVAIEDDCHVLLPYTNLVQWVCEGMVCRSCRNVISPSCLTRTTVGIATSVEFLCDSKMCTELKSKSSVRLEAETIGDSDNDAVLGRGCRDVRSVTNYAANWRLLAATQLVGESQTAGSIFAGFLGLCPSAFQNQWFKMEEEVGDEHDHLAQQCMLCNLQEAVKDKPLHADGKAPLTISFDMGWQKSGRAMNSLSGHAFLIDVHTGKVLEMQVFSKRCLKCYNHTKSGFTAANMPPHKCGQNYDGSSKGMEAAAALQMVKRVFEHKHVQAFVAEMVLDDDASTRALLRHSLEELMTKVADFYWPKDNYGKPVLKSKMSASFRGITL